MDMTTLNRNIGDEKNKPIRQIGGTNAASK
jgi:hypothetical protein